MGRPKNYKSKIVDGIKFDSKRESSRYIDLKILERAGEISCLQLQVKYPFEVGGVKIVYPPDKLGRKGKQMSYTADFVYIDKTKGLIIEDAKGHRTDSYKLKRAIMYSMGYEINEF